MKGPSLLLSAAWSLAVALSFSMGVGTARGEVLDAQRHWLREYRVTEGCPDRRIFESWVERRLSVPPELARAGTRLGVSIERAANGAGIAGTVEVADDAAVTTRRVVDSGSCPEVAEALSLIAALGLEPRGGGESLVPASLSRDLGSGPARRPEPPAPVDGGAARARLSDAAQGTSLRHEVLALGLLHGAAAPEGALGGGVALGLEWVKGWQPALQVGLYRVASAEQRFGGGSASAHFSLVAAQGVFCPMRYPSAGPWALRPCVEAELGRLSGTSDGAGVIGATTRSGVWGSAGLGLRGDVDVWGPLRVSLLGSGVVPLTRHDFSFSPDATLVFRVPAFGWQAAALAGVVF